MRKLVLLLSLLSLARGAQPRGQAQRRHHHGGPRVDRPSDRRRRGRWSSRSRAGTRIRTSSSRSRASCSSSRRRDLLEVVGLELEVGWLPPLLDQSRNAKIRPARAGYLDASRRRRDPRSADGRGQPLDGRRPPAGQPALLARAGQRDRGSRRRSPRSSRRARPADAATSPSLDELQGEAERGEQALDGDARAVSRARRSSRTTARGRTS